MDIRASHPYPSRRSAVLADNVVAASRPLAAQAWARGGDVLRDQPTFAVTFLPGGVAPEPGDRFINKGHAKTLRRIAETRGKAFYQDDLAEAMVAFSALHGGAMTAEDLAGHRADWCGTISRGFDGAELHEIPPAGRVSRR